MWQNTFLEEAVEKDVLLRDTKEEAIKLTKVWLCYVSNKFTKVPCVRIIVCNKINNN